MKKEWIVSSMSGMAYKDGKIYFVYGLINAVLTYDCRNDRISVLKRFPKNLCIAGAFEKLCICKNRIYLFPVYADDVYYYDLNEHKYYGMGILEKYKNRMQSRKIFDVVVYNEFIYCVCLIPNMVIVIDTDKNKFNVYEVFSQISSDVTELENTVYFFHACLNEGKLIYPYGNNTIMEFKLADSSFEIVHLERDDILSERDIYSYICDLGYDADNNLWVCDSNLKLYRTVNNKMTKVVIPDELKKHLKHERWNIMKMFFRENSFYFFLYTNRGVVRYDIAMNKFEWCDSIEIDHKIEGVSYSTYFIEKEGNEIFLFDAQDKSICIWNPNKELVKHLKLRVAFEYICDDNSLNEFYLKYIAGPQDDLKGFIQLIDGKGNQNKQEIDVNSVSCGRVIYDMLK